jgi:hypothetical protein
VRTESSVADDEQADDDETAHGDVVGLAPVRRHVALVHVAREHRHVRVQDRVERGHGGGGGARENEAREPCGRVREEQLGEDAVGKREPGHRERPPSPTSAAGM